MRIQKHRLIELVGLGHPLLPGNCVRHRYRRSFGMIVARRRVPHQDKMMWQVTVMWSELSAYVWPSQRLAAALELWA